VQLVTRSSISISIMTMGRAFLTPITGIPLVATILSADLASGFHLCLDTTEENGRLP